MFLNDIFPNKCAVCGKNINFSKLICESCEDSLFQPSFINRNNKIIYFAGLYEEPLSRLIKEFKFKQNTHFANIFAKMIYKTYKYYNIELNSFPEILYIPSIEKHLKIRGYNPVYLIAKEFSRITGFSLRKKLKIQKGYSKTQVETKSYFERINQIKNKFILKNITIKIKNIY
ncbi:ComF family protein [Marinitoga lauensis]|uniref:ComF family protein n=1 Tax=Marinitoga lauensis TaxID=2201189 RepID=UPI001010DD0D|nr:ComF family protein [Marinitoga lauensis]